MDDNNKNLSLSLSLPLPLSLSLHRCNQRPQIIAEGNPEY